MVVHLQRMHLANVKTFLGKDGMGFTGDIKLSRKTIGRVQDNGVANGHLDISINPRYREKYKARIDAFTKGMKAKQDPLYDGFKELVTDERAWFEYWLKMTEIEKTARSLFRKGAERVYMVGYFVPVSVAVVTNTVDERGALDLFGYAGECADDKTDILKDYQETEDKPHYNYIRELTSLDDLNIQF